MITVSVPQLRCRLCKGRLLEDSVFIWCPRCKVAAAKPDAVGVVNHEHERYALAPALHVFERDAAIARETGHQDEARDEEE